MIPQVGGFQGCYLDNHRNNCPPPPPDQRVGKNEVYNPENLIGHFWYTHTFGSQTPPPPPALPLPMLPWHALVSLLYQHKSLQEFLAVFRALAKTHSTDPLSEIELTSEFPPLQFFTDVCPAIIHSVGYPTVQTVH